MSGLLWPKKCCFCKHVVRRQLSASLWMCGVQGVGKPGGRWTCWPLEHPDRAGPLPFGSLSEQCALLSGHPWSFQGLKDYANAAAPKILARSTPFPSCLDNTEIRETHFWLPFY